MSFYLFTTIILLAYIILSLIRKPDGELQINEEDPEHPSVLIVLYSENPLDKLNAKKILRIRTLHIREKN